MPIINGVYVAPSTGIEPLNGSQQSSLFDNFVNNYSNSSKGAFENPVQRFEGWLDDYDEYVNSDTTPLNSDWNELRALNQGAGEKLSNGLVKFAGNAAITFLDGTVGTVAGIGSYFTGGKFIDNPVSKGLHELSNAMNEKFQTFETKEYQRGGFADKLFSMNFLADGLLASAGFMVGAMAGGGIISMPIKAAAKKGIALALRNAGKNVDEFYAAIKASDKVEDAMKLLPKNTANVINRWEKGSQFMGAALSSIGEARIEALDVGERVKQNLVNSGQWEKMTEEERESAIDGAQTSTMIGNMVVLTGSNFVQWASMFSPGFSSSKSAFNIIANKTGASVAAPLTKTGKVFQFAKNSASILKSPITEGLEEQTQSFISSAATYYGSTRSKDPESNKFMDALTYGLGEAYSTDGWLNFAAGAIMGGLGPNFAGKSNDPNKPVGTFKKLNFAGGIRDAITELRDNKAQNQAKAAVIDKKIKESQAMKLGSQMEELKALMGKKNVNTEEAKKIATLRTGILATFSALQDANKASAKGDKHEYLNAKEEGESILFSTLLETGLLDQYEQDLKETAGITEEDLRELFTSEIKSIDENGNEEVIPVDPNFATTNKELMTAHRENIQRQLDKISEARENFKKIDRAIGAKISMEARAELNTLMGIAKSTDGRIDNVQKELKDFVTKNLSKFNANKIQSLKNDKLFKGGMAYDIIMAMSGTKDDKELADFVNQGTFVDSIYSVVEDLNSADDNVRKKAFTKMSQIINSGLLSDLATDSDGMEFKDFSEKVIDLKKIIERRNAMAENIKDAFKDPEKYSANLALHQAINEKNATNEEARAQNTIAASFPFVQRLETNKKLEQALLETISAFFEEARALAEAASKPMDPTAYGELFKEDIIQMMKDAKGEQRTEFTDWQSFIKTTMNQDKVDAANPDYNLAFLYFVWTNNPENFVYVTQTLSTIREDLKDELKFFIPADGVMPAENLTYNEIQNHPLRDPKELMEIAKDQILVVPVDKKTGAYAKEAGIVVANNLPEATYNYVAGNVSEANQRFHYTGLVEKYSEIAKNQLPNGTNDEVRALANDLLNQYRAEEIVKYEAWRESVKAKEVVLNLAGVNPGAENPMAPLEDVPAREVFGEIDPTKLVTITPAGSQEFIVENGYKLYRGKTYYKVDGTYYPIDANSISEADANKLVDLLEFAANNPDDALEIIEYVKSVAYSYFKEGSIRNFMMFTLDGKLNEIKIGNTSVSNKEIKEKREEIVKFFTSLKEYNISFGRLRDTGSFVELTVKNNKLSRSKTHDSYADFLFKSGNKFTVFTVNPERRKKADGSIDKSTLISNSPALNRSLQFTDGIVVSNSDNILTGAPQAPVKQGTNNTSNTNNNPVVEPVITNELGFTVEWTISEKSLLETRIAEVTNELEDVDKEISSAENFLLGLGANINHANNELLEKVKGLQNKISALEKVKFKKGSGQAVQIEKQKAELETQLKQVLKTLDAQAEVIRETKLTIDRLTKVKNDLTKKLAFFQKTRDSNENVNKKHKIAKAKLVKVNSLIDKLQSIFERLTKGFQKILSYLRVSYSNLEEFVDDVAPGKSVEELEAILTAGNSNYSKFKRNFKILSDELEQDLISTELTEKDLENVGNRITKLTNYSIELQDQIRYLEEILEEEKAEIVKEIKPVAEKVKKEAPITPEPAKPSAPVPTTPVTGDNKTVEIKLSNNKSYIVEMSDGKFIAFNKTNAGKGAQIADKNDPSGTVRNNIQFQLEKQGFKSSWKGETESKKEVVKLNEVLIKLNDEIDNINTKVRKKLIKLEEDLLESKKVTLPENTRIKNWGLEKLEGGLWISVKIDNPENYFGKENWGKIKEAKTEYDTKSKSTIELKEKDIKIIDQKQKNLLSTPIGLELRKAWSFGEIDEDIILGIDSTNYISNEEYNEVTGKYEPGEIYIGYYYLNNTFEDWVKDVTGETKEEVIQKIKDLYKKEEHKKAPVEPDVDFSQVDFEGTNDPEIIAAFSDVFDSNPPAKEEGDPGFIPTQEDFEESGSVVYSETGEIIEDIFPELNQTTETPKSNTVELKRGVDDNLFGNLPEEDEDDKAPFKVENTRTSNISKEERDWFTRAFVNGVIEDVNGLIDKVAVGKAIAGGKILLSNLAKSGTIFHEGFHLLTELFPKESKSAFDNLRKRLGDKVVRVQSGKKFISKKGKDLTDMEANEYLAYNFESYMLGENVNIPPAAEKNLFDKVIDFLRKMMSAIGINSPLTEETTIEQLFEKFKNSKNNDVSITNNSNFSYYRLPGVSASVQNKTMDRFNKEFFFYIANKNAPAGTTLSYPQVESLVNGATDDVNYKDFLNYLEANKPKLYAYWNKSGSEDPTPFINYIVNEHKLLLKSFKLDVFEDLIEEDVESIKETNDLSSKPQGSIDFTSKVPSLIRFAILSLPAVNDRPSMFGMSNYSSIVNLLLNSLSNKGNLSDKIAIMKELVVNYPEIQPLINTLEGPESKESTYFKLTFDQFFNKNKEDVVTVLTGDGITAVDSVIDNMQSRYLDNWKESIKDSELAFENNQGVITFNANALNEFWDKYIALSNSADKVKLFFKEFNLEVPDYIVNRIVNSNQLTSLFQDVDFLVNDIIFKSEGKEVVKRTKSLEVDDIYNSKKVKGSNRLREIAKLVAKTDDSTFSPTYKEADGSNGYSIGLFTNIDIIFDELRKDQIIPKEGLFKHLKPFKQAGTAVEGNPSTKYSEWLNRSRNHSSLFQVSTFKGLSSEEVGKGFNKLNDAEYLAGILAVAYRNKGSIGIPYNRPSDRPLDKIIYSPVVKVFSSEETAEKLVNYLKGELLTILYTSGGIGKKVLKGSNDLSKLQAFDFLNKVLETKIADMVKSANSKSYEELVEEFVETNGDIINKAIIDRVEAEVNEFKSSLISNGLIIPREDGNFTPQAIDTKSLINSGLTRLAPITKKENDGEDNIREVEVLTTNNVDSLANNYIANAIISSMEQSILITGSPVFYKNFSQYNKRTTLFAATRYKASDSSFDSSLDTHYPRLDKRSRVDSNEVRKVTAKDIEKTSDVLLFDNYKEKMNVSDAGSWVMPDQYREVLLKSNINHWTEDVERTWVHSSMKNMVYFISKGAATEADFIQAFGPHLPEGFKFEKNWKKAKTYYKGEEIKSKDLLPMNAHKTQFMGAGRFAKSASGVDSKGNNYNIGDLFVPDSLKSAEQMISIEDLGENSPIMAWAVQAFKDGNDILTFESTAKGAKFPVQDLFTYNNGNVSYNRYDNNLTTAIDWDFYGVQQEIEKKYKGSVVYATQLRNQLIADIPVMFSTSELLADPSKRELLNQAKKYIELTNTRINKLTSELINKLGLNEEGVTEEFKEKLIDALGSDMPLDHIEGLRLSLSQAPYYLDTHIQKQKIESVLNSFFKNNVISKKVNGDAYIQASVAGTGLKLRTYVKEETGTTLSECAIQCPPSWAKHLESVGVSLEEFNDLLKNDRAKAYSIISQDLLEIVANRIPTQAPNLIEGLSIVHLFPFHTGNKIVLPEEHTTKTGSDFDVDKLLTYINSHYRKGKQLVGYKMVTSENKEELFDQFLDLKEREIESEMKDDPTFKAFASRLTNIEADIKSIGSEFKADIDALVTRVKDFTDDQEIVDLKTAIGSLKEYKNSAKVVIEGIEDGSEAGYTLKDKQDHLLRVRAANELLTSVFDLIEVIKNNKTVKGEELKARKESAVKALNTRVSNLSKDYISGLKKEYDSLSVEELNSVKVIDNEINRTAKAIIQNSNYYGQLMTGTDQAAGKLKDMIVGKDKKEEPSKFTLFTPSHNRKLTMMYNAIGVNIGIQANMQGGMGLRQFANIPFSTYDVNTGQKFVNYLNMNSSNGTHVLGNKYKFEKGKFKVSLSEIQSGLMTAFIDLGTDDFITGMATTNNMLSAFNFMSQISSNNESIVDPRLLVRIFKLKSVMDLTNAYSRANSMITDITKESDIENDILESFGAIDLRVERTEEGELEEVEKYTEDFKDLDALITRAEKGEKKANGKLLSLVMYNRTFAKENLDKLELGTRPDRSMPADMSDLTVSKYYLEVIKNSLSFNSNDIDGLIESSYIKSFIEAREQALEKFSRLFLTSHPAIIEQIKGDIKAELLTKSKSSVVEKLQAINKDMANYFIGKQMTLELAANETDRRTKLSGLFVTNKSLNDSLKAVKKLAKTNDVLKSNMALKLLAPVNKKRISGLSALPNHKFLKVSTKRLDSYMTNVVHNNMADLYDLAKTVPAINNLLQDIVYYLVTTTGTKYTPDSIQPIILSEVYYDKVYPVLTKIKQALDNSDSQKAEVIFQDFKSQMRLHNYNNKAYGNNTNYKTAGGKLKPTYSLGTIDKRNKDLIEAMKTALFKFKNEIAVSGNNERDIKFKTFPPNTARVVGQLYVTSDQEGDTKLPGLWMATGVTYSYEYNGEERINELYIKIATKGIPNRLTEFTDKSMIASNNVGAIFVNNLYTDELLKKTEYTPVEVNEDLPVNNGSISLSSYINYSGKAIGSDTIWAIIGKQFGLGKQVDYTVNTLKSLTSKQVEEVENAYQKAVIDLGRSSLKYNWNNPQKEDYVGGLVRRDYLQAKAADAVFAISTIIEPGKSDKKRYKNKTNRQLVEGGTGYAVQMAINLGKPVYVFDQIKEKWVTWNGTEFVNISTPTLTTKFAGIGTREINEAGKKAIEEVYKLSTGNQNTPKTDFNTATSSSDSSTEDLSWKTNKDLLLAAYPELTEKEFKNSPVEDQIQAIKCAKANK